MRRLAVGLLVLWATAGPAGARARVNECEALCRPYVGFCRANGRLYRPCWQNLLQACRLSAAGFPPGPQCTFPCGSDADCGFGRHCVVRQCILPPPAVHRTPRQVCRTLCSQNVFGICDGAQAHLGSRHACRARAMRWCRGSAPSFHCNSGCNTAPDATGDPCAYNDGVLGTCSGGTCYQRIACRTDADCRWDSRAVGACTSGQCVPPPPASPPPPPLPGGGTTGFCTTFENPPCTPCNTPADCGGFDACIYGSSCG